MALRSSHRPFQALAVATALVGLLPLALPALVADPATLTGAYFAWTAAVYLQATLGTLVAAGSFAPGEPMRRGWLLLCASYAVLVPARLLAGPNPSGLGEGALRHPGLVYVGGLASAALALAAFLALAGAWRAAGLDLSTRGARAALRVAAIAVAVAIVGPDVLERFPDAMRGDALALVDVVTDLLDGALFVVAVPVLRAALALGGGLVAWPWALLTLSVLAWLGYDASVIWGEAAGLGGRSARVLEETLRGLGSGTAFAAGVAQRWIMRGPPGGAEPRPPPDA